MKSYLQLSLLLFLFTCCNQKQKEQQRLVNNATLTITTFVKGLSPEISIDTIKIIKIDTVTPKLKNQIIIDNLLNSTSSIKDSIKFITDRVSSNVQLMRLTHDLSDALFKNAKDEYVKDTLMLSDLLRRWKEITTEATNLSEQKPDSTTFLDYYVKFYYEIKDKALEVKRDTGYVIMTQKYGIIKLKDYK